jgi:hypothetical protein
LTKKDRIIQNQYSLALFVCILHNESEAVDMTTVVAKAKKKGPGRPKNDRPTDPFYGRAWIAVTSALQDLAKIRRRSVSAEVGMAAEDLILDAEDELRAAGKWTAELDQLKAERRPDADA